VNNETTPTSLSVLKEQSQKKFEAPYKSIKYGIEFAKKCAMEEPNISGLL